MYHLLGSLYNSPHNLMEHTFTALSSQVGNIHNTFIRYTHYLNIHESVLMSNGRSSKNYLILIVLAFLCSGITFSKDTFNKPSLSSAPVTLQSSAIVKDFLNIL